MENRIEQLKRLMQIGHCAESKSMVHNTCDNTGALMDTYFYFIKACTQKDFPKLDFLREYLGHRLHRMVGILMLQASKKHIKKMYCWVIAML